jgi:hypothetical protein
MASCEGVAFEVWEMACNRKKVGGGGLYGGQWGGMRGVRLTVCFD